MSDIPDKNTPAPGEEAEGGALESAAPQEVLTPEEIKLRDRRELFRALGLLSQIGVSMLVCVALGMGFGWVLDKLLGSSPWLLVFGAFLGGGAALKMMYELVMKK